MAAAVFIGAATPEEMREDMRWIVGNVSPDDRLIALEWGVARLFFVGLQGADPELMTAGEGWLERVAREHPEPHCVLEALLHRVEARGDSPKVRELYALVSGPRFAGTHAGERLSRAYDPDRVLQRGRPLSELDFRSSASPRVA